MTQTALHDTVLDMATPLADALGLEIWGLDLLFGPRLIIRLYVDTPLGAENAQAEGDSLEDNSPESVSPEHVSPEHVSIDQCAHLSRRLGLALEVEDTVPSAYVLEVSSPGLERPFFRIEQLAPYVGRGIVFSISSPLDACPGRKNFTATLESVGDDKFTVLVDDMPGHLNVPWSLVKKARLVHVFPDEIKAKPKSGTKKAASAATQGSEAARAEKSTHSPRKGAGG